MTGSHARTEYLRGRVLTSSPAQLQLLLFDGAIRFTEAAIAAIDARRIEDSYSNLSRAQQIVLALMGGVRREANPELVSQMLALYDFTYGRLVQANMTRDKSAAQDALKILRHQRETWALLLEKLARELPAEGGARRDVSDQAAAISVEG